MNKNTGFTLVTVLILTSMATLVVLSTLRDSVIQERLSGNFQKKLNARLMSEKGVYASIESLTSDILADPNTTIDDLVAANSELSGTGELASSSYNASITLDDEGNLVVSSQGNRFEGEEQMQAVFEYVHGTSGGSETSAFSQGVTGCAGVAVTGSGVIDSYDSSLGDYGDTLADGNTNISDTAFVNTLTDTGHIVLSGGGAISGDVLASGDLTTRVDITGNVHTNGNLVASSSVDIGGNASAYLSYTHQSSGTVAGRVSANDTISISQVHIYGGVQTVGNFEQKGGSVSQGVRALGNVSLNQWGSVIVGDDLQYAGSGSFKGDTEHYYYAPYKVSSASLSWIPPVEKVELGSEAQQGMTTCDPLDLKQAIDAISLSTTSPDLFINNNSSKGDLLELETTLATFLVDYGSTPDGDITAQSAVFLDSSTQILYFDDVTISGRMTVKENHNAVMFVAGDFTMNGASSLTIPDNSSLTIIIEGKLKISSGAQVYTPDNGITPQGRPVFSIYSAYDGSGSGIEFSGGTREVYAVIYAPYSHVDVASAVGFKGSILGETVSVSGAGGIHYDTALGDASFGGSTQETGSSGRLIFKEWRFVTVDSEPET